MGQNPSGGRHVGLCCVPVSTMRAQGGSAPLDAVDAESASTRSGDAEPGRTIPAGPQLGQVEGKVVGDGKGPSGGLYSTTGGK